MTHYTFLAPLTLTPPTDGQPERTLSGVAYAGGVITDHHEFERVAFDLSSTRLDTPAPLLFNHDHKKPIGVITGAAINTEIAVESSLFVSIEPLAAEIAAKADAGMPWQLSVGIWPGTIKEIKAGQSVFINGQSLDGPLTIFENNAIREVSVVALGADSKTHASVFNLTQHEISIMPDIQDISAELEQLKAENAALKADNETLTQKIAEFSAEKNTARVKSLFLQLDKEYSDEAAAVYMGLTDSQFSAIAADLISTKPKAPDYLFSAQATGNTEQANPTDAAKRLFNQVAGIK